MDPFELFNLRAKLTSMLILHYKYKLEKEQYEHLLTLLKSHLEEDVILVREILNKLAI